MKLQARLALSQLALLVLLAPSAAADPFDKPGHPIAAGAYWADQLVSLTRGPLDIANPGGGNASAGTGANALGPATGDPVDTVTLGDGGDITVSFALPIIKAAGDDFAVFENGFFSVDGLFGELAFVEVSSNGSDFARFESEVLGTLPIPAFGTLDPTQYRGLAGDQPGGLGTGFDLDELASHALVTAGTLDLDAVRYVRVIDVVGARAGFGGTTDSFANTIYDPYPTAFAAGGFDLDGIAALQVPSVPVGSAAWWLTAFSIAAFAIRELTRRSQRGAQMFAAAGVAIAAISSAPAAHALTTASFDDAAAAQGLGAESFYNGADQAGGFASGGAQFANNYNTSFGSWDGFAVSNTTDATTPGFTNQYSAIAGGGANGTAAYGVTYAYSPASVFFATPVDLISTQVTNTTYTYLTIRDGDAFTSPFGGPSGDEPDVYTLTMEGFDLGGSSVGSVDFVLADYSFANNALDTIVDSWTQVDLSSLVGVSELRFSLDSTDVGGFGINTPTYAAIDELSFQIVPEPGTGWLVSLGLLGLASRRSRSSSRSSSN